MAKNNPIMIRNEEDEYRQVRHDLFFVVTMTVIFFVILFGLYFINRSTGRIDGVFAHFLKF